MSKYNYATDAYWVRGVFCSFDWKGKDFFRISSFWWMKSDKFYEIYEIYFINFMEVWSFILKDHT